MKKGLFVIPDIHGKYELLLQLLTHWNPDTHHLVQLGDMIDRGENSFGVISELKKWKDQGLATILRGNHEDLFLDFLETPIEEEMFYMDIGGDKTIDSFFGEKTANKKHPISIAKTMKEKFPEEVKFIKNLPLYFEWEDWVFVHAGVNFSFSDWKMTSEMHLNYMDYKKFAYQKNEHPLKFVVGHTHTYRVNQDKSDGIWLSPCQTKFMLDGNPGGGGQLNALIIDDKETYRTIFVK